MPGRTLDSERDGHKLKPAPAGALRPYVLIADDNADMREYMTRLLACDYEVTAVSDGEEALAAIDGRVPDLVLTDVMMPFLDGFELLERLRADPRTQTVPVIIISARAGEESRIEGLEHRADDYLIKPFSARELLARVATHLELAGVRRAVEKKLRHARDRLEARVAERTAELRQSRDDLRQLNTDLDERVREQTQELELMAHLAEHRAAQLAALAEELTRAEHRERRRVAEILHEHIQQLLVASRMQVEAVDDLSPRQEVAFALKQVVKTIQEATDACRSLVVDLSPPVLAAQGLVPAIEWLAERMRELHGLEVEVSAEPSIEPSSHDTGELLFQATRELLLNVVKHAEADCASVRIAHAGPKQLEIEVRDAGRGFSPRSRKEIIVGSDSWGLFHLTERLEQIGGTLSIDSAPGRGTCVTIVVPCRPGAGSDNVIAAAPSTDEMSGNGQPAFEKQGAIEVVVIDDHSTVSQAIASLIDREPDLNVIGEAQWGRVGIDLVRDLEPDVVIMDVHLPDISGIDATRTIADEHPEIPVIGLSMDMRGETAAAMLAAGAVVLLPKDGPAAELIGAIRKAGRRDPAPAAQPRQPQVEARQ
jgi:DNA-binding response OmpR family regulator